MDGHVANERGRVVELEVVVRDCREKIRERCEDARRGTVIIVVTSTFTGAEDLELIAGGNGPDGVGQGPALIDVDVAADLSFLTVLEHVVAGAEIDIAGDRATVDDGAVAASGLARDGKRIVGTAALVDA